MSLGPGTAARPCTRVTTETALACRAGRCASKVRTQSSSSVAPARQFLDVFTGCALENTLSLYVEGIARSLSALRAHSPRPQCTRYALAVHGLLPPASGRSTIPSGRFD